MATQERATVYFEPTLHRALRIKAASTERSVSDLVNAAVRASLTVASYSFEIKRSAARELAQLPTKDRGQLLTRELNEGHTA